MNGWNKNDTHRGTSFVFYEITVDLIIDGKYKKTYGFHSELDYKSWLVNIQHQQGMKI